MPTLLAILLQPQRPGAVLGSNIGSNNVAATPMPEATWSPQLPVARPVAPPSLQPT